MKSKTGAGFKPATHRLLAFSFTELHGKFSNFVQIKFINEKSLSMFVLEEIHVGNVIELFHSPSSTPKPNF